MGKKGNTMFKHGSSFIIILNGTKKYEKFALGILVNFYFYSNIYPFARVKFLLFIINLIDFVLFLIYTG
jgi:hypothetical protein